MRCRQFWSVMAAVARRRCSVVAAAVATPATQQARAESTPTPVNRYGPSSCGRALHPQSGHGHVRNIDNPPVNAGHHRERPVAATSTSTTPTPARTSPMSRRHVPHARGRDVKPETARFNTSANGSTVWIHNHSQSRETGRSTLGSRPAPSIRPIVRRPAVGLAPGPVSRGVASTRSAGRTAPIATSSRTRGRWILQRVRRVRQHAAQRPGRCNGYMVGTTSGTDRAC
jgi:hypothetical protein